LSAQFQALQAKKVYYVSPHVAGQILDFFKERLLYLEQNKSKIQEEKKKPSPKSTSPVEISKEQFEEQKFEAKLLEIFERDFGMKQLLDCNNIDRIERSMFPGLIPRHEVKKIAVPSTLESAHQLFGPCKLVGSNNILPKKQFRDRWLRRNEPHSDRTLEQELSHLSSSYDLTYSVEQIETLTSVIISQGSQTLFLSIPSLELYLAQNNTLQNHTVVQIDNHIGIPDSILEQIQKLANMGGTITKLVEVLWKKSTN
jgi:hypothetical protein